MSKTGGGVGTNQHQIKGQGKQDPSKGPQATVDSLDAPSQLTEAQERMRQTRDYYLKDLHAMADGEITEGFLRDEGYLDEDGDFDDALKEFEDEHGMGAGGLMAYWLDSAQVIERRTDSYGDYISTLVKLQSGVTLDTGTGELTVYELGEDDQVGIANRHAVQMIDEYYEESFSNNDSEGWRVR